MNAVEKHIRHFNKLNGQEVRRSTLRVLYDRVKDIPECKTVANRIEKALNNSKGFTHLKLAGRSGGCSGKAKSNV
jgi:hypothetical protein